MRIRQEVRFVRGADPGEVVQHHLEEPFRGHDLVAGGPVGDGGQGDFRGEVETGGRVVAGGLQQRSVGA